MVFYSISVTSAAASLSPGLGMPCGLAGSMIFPVPAEPSLSYLDDLLSPQFATFLSLLTVFSSPVTATLFQGVHFLFVSHVLA